MVTIKSVKQNIIAILNIIKLNATDSTNSYLKRLVNETVVQDETVILAETQQKGRGQMGNGWVSRTGQSLTFSAFKKIDGVLAEKQFVISMAVSLAISEVFKSLGIPKVSIKWPNDILSDNKKIGGILIENVLEGPIIKHSVIGVGINVNEIQFPGLPQASSIKLEMGREMELDEVFMAVIKSLFRNLKSVSNENFSDFQEIYESNMFRKDVISVFENSEGKRFNGIIKGISSMGDLVVETESTSNEKFQLKELKLIY